MSNTESINKRWIELNSQKENKRIKLLEKNSEDCFLPFLDFLLDNCFCLHGGRILVPVHGKCVAILTSLLSPLCIHSLLLLKPISSFVFVGQHYLLQDLLALWSIECSCLLNILHNKSWTSTEKLQWSRHAWSRGLLIPCLWQRELFNAHVFFSVICTCDLSSFKVNPLIFQL